jgi:hypothetical protein
MFTRRRLLMLAATLLALIAVLLTPLVIIRLDASGHISPTPPTSATTRSRSCSAPG